MAQELDSHSTQGETIHDLAEQARVESHLDTTFNFRGLGELFGQPQRSWIVNQFARAGDVALVYGQSNSGKTLVAVDLMVRGALGKPIFDQFSCQRPFTSLYMFEEGRAGITNRFRASCDLHCIDQGHEAFERLLWDDNVPKLFGTDPGRSANEIIDHIRGFEQSRDIKIDFVLVDTLSDAAEGADENNNADGRKVMGEAQRIAKEAVCVVVLIHHAGKDSSGQPRGASSIRAKADVAIEILGERNPRTIKCNKFRDGRKWESLTFDVLDRLDSAVPQFKRAGSGSDWQSEVDKVLRETCGDSTTAKTSPQIIALLTQQQDERSVREYLQSETANQAGNIGSITKNSVTSGGKKAKKCSHYFWRGGSDGDNDRRL